MDNQITPKSSSNDEIDLLELFNRMGKAFTKSIIWVLNLLLKLFLLILSKAFWIASFMIIGIGLGIAVFYATPRFYSSQMMATANSTNNGIVINAINQLNDLFTAANYTAAAQNLNIPIEQAKKIKSIQAFYGIDINHDNIPDYVDYDNLYNPKDTTTKRVPGLFYVMVKVFDKGVFAPVRNGIEKYIFSNPYIAENNNIRKEQTASMIVAYDKEIQKLDSLQKDYYFNQLTQKAGSGQIIFLNQKDVKLFHKEMLGLVEQKQDLQKTLTLNPDPITVIQDFTQLTRAVNPWTKYVKYWGIGFALLGFFAGVYWQHRKSVFAFLRKNMLG